MNILEELGIEPIMTRSTVALLGKVAALGLNEGLAGVVPESQQTAIELLRDYHGGKRSKKK